MRISTAQQYDNLLQGINRQLEITASRGEQVASDKRFLRPSQAGFDYKTSLDLRHAQKAVSGSLTSIEVADSRLSASETALSSMQNILVRAQTLAVQANSAQLGGQERAAIAIETSHLLDQLFSNMNEQWQNQSLFAGTAVDRPAFSTAFSAGSAIHTAGANTSIAVSQTSNVNAVNDSYTITLDAATRTQIISVTDSSGVNQLAAPVALAAGPNALTLTNGVVLDATYDGTPQASTAGGDLVVTGANVAGNYAYTGSDQDRIVAITDALTVTSNIRGDDPAFLQSLQSLQDFTTALQNNDLAGIGASLGALTQSGQGITDLISEVGGRLSSLQASKVANEDMQFTLDRRINNHEGVDVAQAMAQIQQANVSLQASYSLVARLQSMEFGELPQMMVLRRKVGEAIRIGDDVRIVVQEVQNGRIVRFGIEAPAEIPVHRLEIFELIQAENRAASGANALAWFKGDVDVAGEDENE